MEVIYAVFLSYLNSDKVYCIFIKRIAMALPQSEGGRDLPQMPHSGSAIVVVYNVSPKNSSSMMCGVYTGTSCNPFHHC